MNEARRPPTVQPAADNHGSTRTGIPVPATTKKLSQNMRLSLAGGPAMRLPFPQPSLNLVPGTNPRHSIMRPQNVSSLLQSTSKPIRTPVSTAARRVSTWPSAAPPVAPPSSQVTKDPRPLRDRSFQNKMRQDILNWLQSTGYDISMQTLLNITGNNFRSIVYHLVLQLDPNYFYDPNCRFEDEFVATLKSLQYPFANQIDPKWLAAPASMHSWPFLLGVLHWLVQMSRTRSNYLNSGDPSLQIPEDVPEEFDDPHRHYALAFQFYEQAYALWLDGDDTFAEPRQALEERYAKKNEKVQAELEQKQEQLARAKAEYEKLASSAAPLEELQKKNGLLKTDNEKFQKILQQYEGRKKKLIDAIAHEKTEVAAKALQLEQLQAERDKLSDIVRHQNLSPEEVIQMNAEHEALSRNLEDLKQKISETQRSVMSLEVNVANRVAAAEEALDTYNNLLSSVGLFPPLPQPFEDLDLTLELNPAATNPTQLLSGADIRKVIKPTLSRIAEQKRSQRAEVESERIKIDNELDEVIAHCENLEEEINQMEKKVANVNEQADDLREAAQQEAQLSNAEATRLERELAQARNAALAHGMGVKARLQALQFQYREQEEKINRLRDETVRAIIKNTNDIALFKEEVSRHFRELREFAEAD